ncbi:FMRFamide receptor-like [Biomphalaria glabrata]|uniref:FMRFamide receptor-like n=1 Tax=Biomphalaria glabrata TaxID=6526 RepID=A0A9W3AMT0_BIOGL|nr:FMRFamide receptor-like [Biomphalaria glabrata]
MTNFSNADNILNQTETLESSGISDYVYFMVLLVTNGIIANILSLLGITGSILNIIILSHHKMQDTTNVVLLAISVCDLMYSLTQISFNLTYTSFLLSLYIYQWVITLHAICLDYVNYLSFILSIHLVTLVSIERMVAICFPFHVSRIFTVHRIQRVIISLLLFNIIFMSPWFVTYNIDYINYNDITLPALEFSAVYLHNYVILYNYTAVILFLLIAVFPFCIILLCTCLTLFNISLSSKRKSMMSTLEAIAKRQKEMKSVKMVLVICVFVLFLVVIPWGLQQIFLILISIPIKLSNIIVWIVNILVQINSSFNFVIYVTGSPKFKKTFIQLLFKQKGTKH